MLQLSNKSQEQLSNKSQKPTEPIKSYVLDRELELLENQFTLQTIYLVEIAKVKLCQKTTF